MVRYQRILATTDLSDINRPAIARAVDLAKQYDSELLLLYVIEHFQSDGALSSVFDPGLGPEDPLFKEVRERMSELMAELDFSGAQLEIRITPKSAQKEILRFAKGHGIDLIVVAPHGEGFFGMLGSTASGVLNGAECDVLAVRESDEQP